jgi:MoaA/NifB/PqqE/SkfB family radical SAM enzyme
MRQLKDINRELAFMEKQVRKLKVKSLPCYLSIDTTSRCNLKCKFCYRNYSEEDYNKIPDMSGDVLDKIIKELFPTAWTFNLSSFGEPLLSTQIEKVLKACSDYQVYLSMTTNGTLLKGEEFIKKVASVLHYIEISFDSMDPKLFEKLRDGSSYEQVLRNASKLGEIRCSLPDPKFSLGFSMTLFRQNLMEVPDILEVVHTIGGNFLKTDFGVIFSKKELHSSVLTCPDLYNEIYRIAHERARQIGINLLMRPPFKEDCQWKATKPGICDYLYLSACIRSEEKLNPCYFHVIPSLKVKNGFKSAWNSEIMRRLRAFHDTNKGHPLCKDCYLFLEGNDSVENRRKQFLYGDALE